MSSELPEDSSPAPGRDAEERILESFLADLDEGRDPDPEALRRRFADSTQTVSAMVQVLSRFKDLRQALRSGERPPRLSPGERLGDFEIHSFLQRGAVGEVYRASQLSLRGRPVALKVIPARDLTERERERFLREALLASRVHHAHLVEVYASGQAPELDLLYYAMRLVEGPTLRAVLEERCRVGPPGVEDSRIIVKRVGEVSSALAALHTHGLVHRDVKPSNIMLDGGGVDPLREHSAVLVDYGLLRPFAREMTGSSLRLTVAYAAPEQLLGKPADPRADVFALGAVLHDLLCARLPEERRHAAEGLGSIRKANAVSDRDLDAIVGKATEVEPDWRYPDAAAFELDLRAWLDGRPVSARPPSPARRAIYRLQANPARVLRSLGRTAAGLVAAGVLIVAVLFLAWTWRSARRVEAAWNEGHMAEVARALESVPSAADSILLPAEVASLADELRSGHPSIPLAQVVRVSALDRSAATRLAAAYVERDGLVRSPDLGRFLLHELAESPTVTVPLVARLFMERADATPDDVRASSHFKERLLEVLEDPPDDLSAQFCLTALSGCATPSEAVRIAEWARRRARERGASAMEDVRLVHAALGEVLFWRASGCGFLEGLRSDELDRVLGLCSESLEVLDEVNLPDSVSAATSSLFLSVEYARRLAGLETGTILPALPRAVPLALRAARRDPILKAELFRGPAVFDFNDQRGNYLDFGMVVGAYGEPDLSGLHEQSVRLHAGVARVPELEAVSSFRIGLKRMQDRLRGRYDERLPDEDTHLAAALDVADEPWARLDAEVVEPVPDAVVVANFEELRPRVAGRGIDLQARSVLILPQEDDPAHAFARLGVSGESGIRLHFECPEGVAMDSIDLLLQKGSRRLLPMCGTAYVEVFFDGEPRGKELAVRSGTHEETRISLRLEPERGTARHTVELRVSPSSNTTLRLHSVRVNTWDGKVR